MGSRYVGLDRVKEARAVLKTLVHEKSPTIRTDHYAQFLANFTEIKRLRQSTIPWHEIRLRYYGRGEDAPHIRTLQRYFEAAKADKRRGV